MGCGIIFLFLIAVCLVISYILEKRKIIKYISFDKKIAFVIVIFVILIFTVIALSPIWTIGNHVILKISMSEKIYRLWSVFRSSGRFVWPVVYLIMIGSIVAVFKLLDYKKA